MKTPPTAPIGADRRRSRGRDVGRAKFPWRTTRRADVVECRWTSARTQWTPVLDRGEPRRMTHRVPPS